MNHAYQICVQSGSHWPQMGQIRDVFRSDFSTFWLTEICGQSEALWAQMWPPWHGYGVERSK